MALKVISVNRAWLAVTVLAWLIDRRLICVSNSCQNSVEWARSQSAQGFRCHYREFYSPDSIAMRQ